MIDRAATFQLTEYTKGSFWGHRRPPKPAQ
jgi:hypothetical protein